MDTITIKVTYYDSNGDRKVDYFSKEYNQTTTLPELMMDLPNKDLLICYDENAWNVDRKAFSYLMIDGKCEWLVPYEECLVKDYVNTYSDLIEFVQPGGIGGLSFQVALEFISKICDVIGVAEFAMSLMNWAKSHLIKDIGYVTFTDLEKCVTSKNYYSLDEFCFSLDIDEESAKMLLEFFGYKYFEEYGLYLYVPGIYEKNKERLFYTEEPLG